MDTGPQSGAGADQGFFCVAGADPKVGGTVGYNGIPPHGGTDVQGGLEMAGQEWGRLAYWNLPGTSPKSKPGKPCNLAQPLVL